MTISLRLARRRLAVLWFAGAGLIFLVMLFISLVSRNLDQVGLWDWFVQTVAPNLSLIVAVLVHAQGQGTTSTGARADDFLYSLAFWLSASYLALIALPLLFHPFTGKTLPEVLETSRLWLPAVQGLVTGAMGAFFVRPQTK